jgi:hypothetical protein
MRGVVIPEIAGWNFHCTFAGDGEKINALPGSLPYPPAFDGILGNVVRMDFHRF